MDIIISGVSRGIGRAITMEALRPGKNRIIGLSRNEKSFEAIIEESAGSGSTFHGLKADLSKDYYLPTLVNMLVTLNFRPQIIISNAAILVKMPFIEMKEGDFERCFRLNVWAPVRLVQALLPYIPEDSHIVNICAMGGIQGSPKVADLSVYNASKAALASLTESMAVELKPRKISVNAIAPGSVNTQMLKESFPKTTPEITAEQAGAYIWQFASTAHQYMNGKIIPMSIRNP